MSLSWVCDKRLEGSEVRGSGPGLPRTHGRDKQGLDPIKGEPGWSYLWTAGKLHNLFSLYFSLSFSLFSLSLSLSLSFSVPLSVPTPSNRTP